MTVGTPGGQDTGTSQDTGASQDTRPGPGVRMGRPDPSSRTSLHESWLPKFHPLYRPRHPNQLLARACALIFFVVPLAALAVVGMPPAIENRPVHGFPSLAQGWGFFSGLLPWAVDSLAFRQGAIRFADGVSHGLFGEPAPLGQGNQDSDTGPLPAAPPATTTPQTVPDNRTDQTSDGYPEVIEGTDGWLYFGFDVQGRCEPAQPLTTVMANLQRLRDAVQRSGREFFLFVPPDKSSVQPEHLPPDYVGKACATTVDQQFWQQMDTTSGAIDPRPELQAAAEETGKPVYFPQDTHWTFTGGLVMTRELAERIQPGVSTTWRVTQGVKHSGAADLPPMIATSGTDTAYTYHLAPDGITNRDRPVASDVQAPVTLHTDDPATGMVRAKTTMIDDSFAQYASPLLAATFADLTMVGQQAVASDPTAEADRMVASQVVVVEVVERDLVAGVSPVTTESFVDAATADLAAHPAH